MNYYLSVRLMSDACFSGGIGVAGEVDTDIEYEEETGLPMVRGRTLKGLLVEECAMLLNVLNDNWHHAAKELFGIPGADTGAALKISDARLPETVCSVVKAAVKRNVNALNWHEVLRSFTDIRFQTKISHTTGAPEEHSLRSTRVALKGLEFQSHLSTDTPLSEPAKTLLAACVLATRRGGLNRNRGWGKLKIRIMAENQHDVTQEWISPLKNQEGE